HLALGWQITEHDRTAGASRRQLHNVHLLGPGVMIEIEADLVTVELDRAIDVADRQDHNLQGPVHAPSTSVSRCVSPRRERIAGWTRIGIPAPASAVRPGT